MPELACNVDIGGTHTDAVVIDKAGESTVAKVPSTPADFSEGFFDVLERSAKKRGTDLRSLLNNTGLLAHGTTVGTNALIERDGADAAMVSTRGTEDVLYIMRGAAGVSKGLPIEEVYRYQDVSKPTPFVPREKAFGVDERVDSMGEVVVEFNEERAREVARELKAKDVDAVGVSFLFSFLNDDHEERMRAVIEEEFNDPPFLSLGSELAPKLGEYERTSTVAVNTYIGPVVADYVDRIEEGLEAHGFDGSLLIMETGGGVVPSDRATEEPFRTVHSGPAGGVIGCKELGGMLSHDDVIAMDMGGTSFDAGLITNGKPITSPTNVVDKFEYYARNLGVETIGNGGGSIARVDTGRLTVGPESAGADPGPVCYGLGGTEPTVTDADLVLGYLDPERFLGGQMSLDLERAEERIGELGKQLGMDVTETASGIVEIANEKMADLLRELTIRKGYDPRKFAVYTYGGAGPMHAADIARELEVSTVVVPGGNRSGIWSAVGLGYSDVQHLTEITEVMEYPFDPDDLTERYESLESDLRDQLREEGFEDVTVERHADIRFGWQVHELTVPVSNGDLDIDDVDRMIADFEEKYESRYGEGAGYSEAGYELAVTWCEGVGATRSPTMREWERTDRTPTSASSRKVYWASADRQVGTDVYYPDDLNPGAAFNGPAVVQMADTTIAVPPAAGCEVDSYGNFVINTGV